MQVPGQGRERTGWKGHHCPHTPQELGLSPAALGDELDKAIRQGRQRQEERGVGGRPCWEPPVPDPAIPCANFPSSSATSYSSAPGERQAQEGSHGYESRKCQGWDLNLGLIDPDT